MLRVLLVRHAAPVFPTVGSNERTRPLTETGLQQAASLAHELRDHKLNAIYSSPYLRAIQTVQPLAEARGLAVKPIEDFREHRLGPEPIDDWREVIQRVWTDFDSALPGAETMRSSQNRIWTALESLRSQHSSGTIAIGGHGTAFALLLHKIDSRVNATFHLSMPMPAVYSLESDGGWRVVNGLELTP